VAARLRQRRSLGARCGLKEPGPWWRAPLLPHCGPQVVKRQIALEATLT
jgi:hypothetical protein